MEYRRMGKSGLQLSVLSYGSWVTFHKQLDDSKADEPGDHERDRFHYGHETTIAGALNKKSSGVRRRIVFFQAQLTLKHFNGYGISTLVFQIRDFDFGFSSGPGLKRVPEFSYK